MKIVLILVIWLCVMYPASDDRSEGLPVRVCKCKQSSFYPESNFIQSKPMLCSEHGIICDLSFAIEEAKFAKDDEKAQYLNDQLHDILAWTSAYEKKEATRRSKKVEVIALVEKQIIEELQKIVNGESQIVE